MLYIGTPIKANDYYIKQYALGVLTSSRAYPDRNVVDLSTKNQVRKNIEILGKTIKTKAYEYTNIQMKRLLERDLKNSIRQGLGRQRQNIYSSSLIYNVSAYYDDELYEPNENYSDIG